MHGLVLVDLDRQVLRPSVIWCDSRAVETGNKAFNELGEAFCLEHFLNSPGNFTASKLKWIRDNEPAIYEKDRKSVVSGKSVSVRVDLGGRRLIKQKMSITILSKNTAKKNSKKK